MPVVRTRRTHREAKKWCFTINNPEEGDEISFDAGTMKYLVYQLEEGEEETPHYQGFIWMKKRRSLLQMKALNARAHWEVAKGSAKQNRHYCMKPVPGCECAKCAEAVQLGQPKEFGSMDAEDAGALMAQLIQFAKDGLTFNAACDLEPRIAAHGRAWKNYVESLNAVRGNQYRPITVEVYIGEPGCGKTRHAVEDAGGYGKCYILTKLNKGATWFDGYEGQETLVIDDFDSQWSIPYRGLLRLLDVHPVRLPVKGAFTYALFKRVVITTNEPVREWYRERREIAALERRISRVVQFPLAGLDQWLVGGGGGGGIGGPPIPQAGGNTEPISSAPRFCHRSSTGVMSESASTPLLPLADVIESISSDDATEPIRMSVSGFGSGGERQRGSSGHAGLRRGNAFILGECEASGSGGSDGDDESSLGSLAEFITSDSE